MSLLCYQLQGILIVVLYKVGPRQGESVYHPPHLPGYPNMTAHLRSCFLLPGLFFLPGYSSQSAQTIADKEGPAQADGKGPSSSAIVWADCLEWPGRKKSPGSKKQDL